MNISREELVTLIFVGALHFVGSVFCLVVGGLSVYFAVRYIRHGNVWHLFDMTGCMTLFVLLAYWLGWFA